ncbi:MAG: fructosamine kinase family protein [Nibricoccus sp.]
MSTHLGRPWTAGTIVDLGDRASHPSAILRGEGLDVFAKLSTAVDGTEQFDAEQRGLLHVQRHAGVLVPSPIGAGIVTAGDCAVLVLEALPEITPARARTGRVAGDRPSAGPAARRHRPVVRPRRAGCVRRLPRTVAPAERSRCRRVGVVPPRTADRTVPSGGAAGSHLPPTLDRRLDHLVARLDSVAGPEPVPSLLHGDAQQHNFVSTPGGAALIDVSPYFGHPEVDLAMLGIFRPVPDDVLDGYRDVRPIAADATARIELWRLPAYLAVIAADGANPFSHSFVPRLAAALTLSGA